MGYQMWCEALRSPILATAWLLVFIFLLFLMCHYAVNWCNKLRICIYIRCFIASFSYRTRLVIKQSWSHSHSLNDIHDSFLIRNLIFQNHRLRGSASPVLTATHHSYGSPRLSDFFSPLGSGGQTPQRTSTQNGSNDVFSRKDVPFAVKVATFHTH